MNDKRIFELTGIKVIKEIEYESKLLIINNITNLLTQKIKTINYRQIKEKLLDTPIYLAEVPEQYYGVVYLHDNSTIYIDSTIDVLELSETVIHEFIHAIQTKKDKKNNN